MPENRSSQIGGLLFDLDGTFADTAPDLAFALNETLRAWNRPELPYSQIRPVVSHGGIALIRLGFGMEPGDEGFEDRQWKAAVMPASTHGAYAVQWFALAAAAIVIWLTLGYRAGGRRKGSDTE